MSQDDGRYSIGPKRAAQARPAPNEGGAADASPASLAALSERYGVPAVDLEQVSFPTSNLDLIPVEIARRQCVLPVLIREDAIALAMADPSDRRVIDELEFVSAKRVFPYVAERAQLVATIERAYQLRDEREPQFHGARAARAGESAAPGTGSSVRGAVGGAINEPLAPLPGTVMPTPGAGSLDDGDDELDSGLRFSTPSVVPGGTPASGVGMNPNTGGATRLSVPAASTAAATPGGKPGPTLDSVFTPLNKVAGGKTVLVVDDEEDIRKLLRRVLEGKGYQVLEADRGSVALAMVKQHAPDVIVLDAMLPELHGFDICRRIKASARYGHIPILMISAVYRGWRYAEDLKAAYGVNAYIEKPFRLADVLSTVEQLLAGAPRGDELDPETLSAEADAALNAGMAAYKSGDLEGAIAQLERGLGVDPLSYRLHYHLALLVGRTGDVFRAIQELETAINLNPKSFPALKNLAVLYQKAGFKNKAIEMWERAIGQSPDDETRGQIKDHLMSLL